VSALRVAFTGTRLSARGPSLALLMETLQEAIRDSKWASRATDIVVGDATGVDLLVTNWATGIGKPVWRFRADWQKYGKAAGPRRNAEMLEQADALVAIWDGESRGTLDCINQAQKKGIPVEIFHVLREKPNG
jgi:hypothetical protein